MGYNDVILSVRHGDKSDERVLFHKTGSISSDKSRSIGFLITNATTVSAEFANNNVKYLAPLIARNNSLNGKTTGR